MYEEFGVKEYWLVHTTDQLVDVFELEDDSYRLRKIYAHSDKINSRAVSGLVVDLGEVFENLLNLVCLNLKFILTLPGLKTVLSRISDLQDFTIRTNRHKAGKMRPFIGIKLEKAFFSKKV